MRKMLTPGEGDRDRIARVRAALHDADLDALVCALPANVLLLSGYWPVVGTALAVVGPERTVLIAPSDEKSLAQAGWADETKWFESGSLEEIETAAEVVRRPLAEALRSLGVERGCIGYEAGTWYEPASYVSMHLYGAGMVDLLEIAAPPHATLAPADAVLSGLRSVKTPGEIERIRNASRISGSAFLAGTGELKPGVTEVEGAALFAVQLADPGAPRSGGHVAFMSGIRSASAHGAYARSTAKQLAPGELVLVHCNACADGYWTDITRTFCLGSPDARQRRMYDAVSEARAAALSAIRPGVAAREVDRAARDVMRTHGFGDQFKHPTGHGVGFAAIDHDARPRLHPKSDDILQVGSVFNVEPAVYLEGLDGLRHCDMVAVTEGGAELLTPFQGEVDELIC